VFAPPPGAARSYSRRCWRAGLGQCHTGFIPPRRRQQVARRRGASRVVASLARTERGDEVSVQWWPREKGCAGAVNFYAGPLLRPTAANRRHLSSAPNNRWSKRGKRPKEKSKQRSIAQRRGAMPTNRSPEARRCLLRVVPAPVRDSSSEAAGARDCLRSDQRAAGLNLSDLRASADGFIAAANRRPTPFERSGTPSSQDALAAAWKRESGWRMGPFLDRSVSRQPSSSRGPAFGSAM